MTALTLHALAARGGLRLYLVMNPDPDQRPAGVALAPADQPRPGDAGLLLDIKSGAWTVEAVDPAALDWPCMRDPQSGLPGRLHAVNNDTWRNERDLKRLLRDGLMVKSPEVAPREIARTAAGAASRMLGRKVTLTPQGDGRLAGFDVADARTGQSRARASTAHVWI